MHPVLGVLASIGVLVGMYISWKIGWHLDDWVSKIFSYRVSSTDTHLVFTKASPAEIEEHRLSKIMGNAWMTHNEIREMKRGCKNCDESLHDDCRSCYDHQTYLNGAEKVRHLNNEQVDVFLEVMEEGVKHATTQDEIDKIREDLLDIKIVSEGRELELSNLVEKFKHYRVENI